jgi:NADH-quinone oxidoreductase subunit M
MMYLAHHTQYQWVSFISGKLLWVLFFIGFAIKIPMFPFHTWLPDAHVEAPTAISVILAGVLLKMGTYGILRINYPMFPAETVWASTAMAAFGMINIVYGAFCAMAQKDFKSLVAYSSISHMGFVLLGMSSFTQEGMNGAVLQMFNHGISSAALFFMVGVIYDRTHTRALADYGGLRKIMPIYAGVLGVSMFSSLGLPGLNGFVGEFLIFRGVFPVVTTVSVVAMIGLVVTAVFLLQMMQKVCFGPLNEKWQFLPDMTARELFIGGALMLFMFLIGIYPAPLLDAANNAVMGLVKLFEVMR